jgi:hypothetical protein
VPTIGGCRVRPEPRNIADIRERTAKVRSSHSVLPDLVSGAYAAMPHCEALSAMPHMRGRAGRSLISGCCTR